MKRQGIILTIFASGALLLSGCGSSNTQTGAVVGSLVGAGIASATGNRGFRSSNRDREILQGAAIGGLIGGVIGNQQDKRDAAYRAASTSQYNNGSNHSHGGASHSHVAKSTNTQQVQRPSVSHTHGNKTHTHPGGSGKHDHNARATTNTQTVQQGHSHSTHTHSTNTVYVERPYYPVSTSIILGTGGFYGRSRFRGHRGFRGRGFRGNRFRR